MLLFSTVHPTEVRKLYCLSSSLILIILNSFCELQILIIIVSCLNRYCVLFWKFSGIISRISGFSGFPGLFSNIRDFSRVRGLVDTLAKRYCIPEQMGWKSKTLQHPPHWADLVQKLQFSIVTTVLPSFREVESKLRPKSSPSEIF